MYTGVAQDRVIHIMPSTTDRSNFISGHTADKLGLLNDRAHLLPWPTVTCGMYVGDAYTTVQAYVCNSMPLDCDVILGVNWIRSHYGFHDWRNRRFVFEDPHTGENHHMAEKRSEDED